MRTPDELPLAGTLVLDFSQFLAGPVAALRLADLGARVIKVERPGTGDLSRALEFAGIVTDGDSLLFHIMNRKKESFAADLKTPEGLADVRALVARADVMIQNFRPGVMERLGLDYSSVRAINPSIVYASVSGYGTEGPWRDLPGQDLLAQSMSGLPWLSGSRESGPVPLGLSVADLLASCHLAQGITALLVRRERTGAGGLVETSLMEGMLDLQFEVLSARLNDSSIAVERGGAYSANAFLPAPYGIYPTADGHLALAMNPVPKIGELIGLPDLAELSEPATWRSRRDEIADMIAIQLATRTTRYWLDILQPADVWCAELLSLPALVAHSGFAALQMTQQVVRQSAEAGSVTMTTTRNPIRIDGSRLVSATGAPILGEHTEAIRTEFGLTTSGGE